MPSLYSVKPRYEIIARALPSRRAGQLAGNDGIFIAFLTRRWSV